ncbi:unnamed protein product [Onchocerca ochengi]|uniref:GRIP domain-containing protein n=1 Tax=Onchocerca ochengi TaxID=42157 RepID=A0A182EBB2_ONCOC|nr:unnamed protein product [Onchocerca ochengi]
MNTYVQQLKEEYEKRLRVSERSLHGEKERRRQLGFQCKQLEAQLRKVQRDNESMAKQLKIVKKCASCSHLDLRSKSYNALNELLQGSVAALKPDVIASISAPNRNDELEIIKTANNNLQQCVDKLQNMLSQKEREALAAEKYYNDAISEREQQISRLQLEANHHIETKLKVLLKERTDLLNRINRLEKENKENRNVVHNEPQRMSGKVMDSSNFVNTDPDSNRLNEKDAAMEKIQLLNSYEKLLQRYECLETELGKRLKADQNIIKKINQNDQIASKGDVFLISQLKDELDKANKKMACLEKELTLAKRTIYENEQFIIATPQKIKILEKDKKELTHIIDNQTERLNLFEDQLRTINKEKEALQRKYIELEHANNLAIQEKLEQLQIIEMQRKKLLLLEEKQIEKIKAHDAQIEAYQQLIKQKDDERGALIAELCAASRYEAPLHDTINEFENRFAAADENRELLKEVRELNHEKQTMLDKITRLESELQSMKDQLRLKTDEVEKEVLLKNSMHDDLAKARTMLLEKEAQILDLNNELKVAEVKIMKLETELANATDRLQVEQSTGNTLKMTVEELEDLLQQKSAELITAAQERQRCTAEMQKMKELKYDLETKLQIDDIAYTLQGRKLKEAREKLAVLKKKIRELELEAMNSADKSLCEITAQQGSSKSTTPSATTTMKSAVS